jgi:phosphoribosylanthranilate isomerase
MTQFRVKVCGITRPEDALMASELGADLIGMIFYHRSPRFVQPQEAEAIINGLPKSVARVGVFVDEPVQIVLELADRLRLDYVQLHGNEPYDDIDQIRQAGFEVIRAYRILGLSDWENLYSSQADLVLVDNATADLKGGTGQTFDWSIEPPRHVTNLVLSGGLTVDNIEDGVKRFDPVIIDVNSGVESAPGIKSKHKLIEFLGKCDKIRNAK